MSYHQEDPTEWDVRESMMKDCDHDEIQRREEIIRGIKNMDPEATWQQLFKLHSHCQVRMWEACLEQEKLRQHGVSRRGFNMYTDYALWAGKGEVMPFVPAIRHKLTFAAREHAMKQLGQWNPIPDINTEKGAREIERMEFPETVNLVKFPFNRHQFRILPQEDNGEVHPHFRMALHLWNEKSIARVEENTLMEIGLNWMGSMDQFILPGCRPFQLKFPAERDWMVCFKSCLDNIRSQTLYYTPVGIEYISTEDGGFLVQLFLKRGGPREAAVDSRNPMHQAALIAYWRALVIWYTDLVNGMDISLFEFLGGWFGGRQALEMSRLLEPEFEELQVALKRWEERGKGSAAHAILSREKMASANMAKTIPLMEAEVVRILRTTKPAGIPEELDALVANQNLFEVSRLHPKHRAFLAYQVWSQYSGSGMTDQRRQAAAWYSQWLRKQ